MTKQPIEPIQLLLAAIDSEYDAIYKRIQTLKDIVAKAHAQATDPKASAVLHGPPFTDTQRLDWFDSLIAMKHDTKLLVLQTRIRDHEVLNGLPHNAALRAAIDEQMRPIPPRTPPVEPEPQTKEG
jgi:hypothetical protein